LSAEDSAERYSTSEEPHRVVVDAPGVVYARTTSHNFVGRPPEMQMYNVAVNIEIIRRRRRGSIPGGGGARGGIFDVTIVKDAGDAVSYVMTVGFYAYHPDDVRRWYRTEAACEAALAPAQPPVAL
jgi:hypothetical protein